MTNKGLRVHLASRTRSVTIPTFYVFSSAVEFLCSFSHIFYCISNNIIIFAFDMGNELNNKRREKIGSLLQHERKCMHVEQKNIARKMDARQETISKIESGTRRIDIPELIDYADALGFSITEIVWKIENYLSALSLLPFPKRSILSKKIRVNVSWLDNKFTASISVFAPETIVFNADTFAVIQMEIDKYIDSLIKEMVAKGHKVPWWLENKEYEYKFLDARSLLNAYIPYISLAAISRVSGINQNLLSQYANGLKKASPNQMKRIMEAINRIGKELSAIVV